MKGHVGVPQNEICDERAKKEVIRCTEGIVEEALESFGEIRNKGMRVESHKEIGLRRTWMERYATEVMRCCRSRMAKRVQMGIERWKGNTSVFKEESGERCQWCHLTHGLNFFEMVRTCPKLLPFRNEVKSRWKKTLDGETFDDEILFGKIKRSLFQKICQGKDEKKIWRDTTQNLRWWERRLGTLRTELEEHLAASGEETETESEDEGKTPMEELAKEIRVFDEGLVKKGEPDIYFPDCQKSELKKFLSRKKKNC